jgi:hypothetical protein
VNVEHLFIFSMSMVMIKIRSTSCHCKTNFTQKNLEFWESGLFIQYNNKTSTHRNTVIYKLSHLNEVLVFTLIKRGLTLIHLGETSANAAWNLRVYEYIRWCRKNRQNKQSCQAKLFYVSHSMRILTKWKGSYYKIMK